MFLSLSPPTEPRPRLSPVCERCPLLQNLYRLDVGSRILLADIENNGRDIIAVYSPCGNVTFVRPDGTFIRQLLGLPTGSACGGGTGGSLDPTADPEFAVADLDGDGKVEIVIETFGQSGGGGATPALVSIFDAQGKPVPGGAFF